MNSKLLEAVKIFKELGWEKATKENVMSLPLGTKEQKKIALQGLKTGDFHEWEFNSKGRAVRKEYIDVDKGYLAIFALRVGVDARRFVNIANSQYSDVLVEAVCSRGEKYVVDFIRFACSSSRRGWEHSASVFGEVAVKLVDKLNLKIPESSEYIKDWSVYAGQALGKKTETSKLNKETAPTFELIERTFEEHIVMGIAVNAPATGPFPKVLLEGVNRGLLQREKAIELIFVGIDSSVRPGDRKAWVEILNELNITDKELVARSEALISILNNGDNAIISTIGTRLILNVDESMLSEVIMSCLSTTTKKGKIEILKSALERDKPENVEIIIPWISMLISDKDKTVSKNAKKLMEKWKINDEEIVEEETEILGLWQRTPKLWECPKFEIKECTQEALTDIASEILNRQGDLYDVVMERFLALLVHLAYNDIENTKLSLKGIKKNEGIFYYIINWTKDEESKYGLDGDDYRGEYQVQEPILARTVVLFSKLGKLPCLLSTPSKDDMTTDLSDIVKRLKLYKENNLEVLESDLHLALTRLDVKTKNDKDIKELKKLDIPILLQSGEAMSINASQAIITYLDNPIETQDINVQGYRVKFNTAVEKSFPEFPNRLHAKYFSYLPTFTVFPLGEDNSFREIRFNEYVYSNMGLKLRQGVRQSKPLTKGVAINLLGAQRPTDVNTTEDYEIAVIEAWERGLLIPNQADVTLLDWSDEPPTNLVAFSKALEKVANNGILSVVWPILDDLVRECLKAPRLIVGTAEIVELALLFLPEVKLAIEKGLADKSVLDLPAIRELALRKGTSRAITTAKKIVESIPYVEVKPKGNTELVMKKPFDEIWKEIKNEKEIIEDNVEITVELAEPESKQKVFLFTLKLPDISDKKFQVVKNGWYYDLESEGQCDAIEVSMDTTLYVDNKENRIWLHWDKKQNKMVVTEHRNWVENKSGPLEDKKNNKSELTISLLTIIIGVLAQSVDEYYAGRLTEDFIKTGDINVKVVKRVMKDLLKSEAVSPSKIIKLLEKKIELLYVLWPMLTESVRVAGEIVEETGKPPVWVNRTLDTVLRYAPYLVEATKRGLISKEDSEWVGLSTIASSKAKSVAVDKAKNLLEILN